MPSFHSFTRALCCCTSSFSFWFSTLLDSSDWPATPSRGDWDMQLGDALLRLSARPGAEYFPGLGWLRNARAAGYKNTFQYTETRCKISQQSEVSSYIKYLFRFWESRRKGAVKRIARWRGWTERVRKTAEGAVVRRLSSGNCNGHRWYSDVTFQKNP